jgi:hypothetical protein
MSQNQSTARTQHTSKARLRSLAAKPALITLVAAGMIAGSTGIAAAATSSSAPVGSHSCALKTDGTLWCWGVDQTA